MKEILDAVKSYIDQQQSAKTWVAGRDFVNYAGSYFDSQEYAYNETKFSEVNVDERGDETDVVIGSSAIVLREAQEGSEKALTAGTPTPKGEALLAAAKVHAATTVPIIYDPYSPVLVNNTGNGRGPMHKLNTSDATETSTVDVKNTSFPYLCRHRGTIFVYKSVSQKDDEMEIGL